MVDTKGRHGHHGDVRIGMSPVMAVSTTGVPTEVIAPYGGPVRAAIRQLKYGEQTIWAWPLGRLLFDALEARFEPDEVDLILPNPTHRHRRIRHTELLVEAMRRCDSQRRWAFDEPAHPALVKARPTPRSYGGDIAARRAAATALYLALTVSQRGRIEERQILVIDDVATTGCQLARVSQKLLEHGARRVSALVVAAPQRHRRRCID